MATVLPAYPDAGADDAAPRRLSALAWGAGPSGRPKAGPGPRPRGAPIPAIAGKFP